jgi:hypothetical protein
MNHDSCLELYNCQKVKMTPLIRALLRCTAAEAMDSICTTCARERYQGEQDDDYVAPSGQRMKVVVRDDAEQMVGASACSHPATGFLAS